MKVVRKPGPGAERLKNLQNLGSKEVGKVGWFESAKYPDGTPVAYVATIQEYGDPKHKIPARATMRPTIRDRQAEWKKQMNSGARAILAGNIDMHGVLEQITQGAAGDVRKAITELQTPALKPATIKARMSRRADKKTKGNLNKPLVDTTLLLTSLTSVVEKK